MGMARLRTGCQAAPKSSDLAVHRCFRLHPCLRVLEHQAASESCSQPAAVVFLHGSGDSGAGWLVLNGLGFRFDATALLLVR